MNWNVRMDVPAVAVAVGVSSFPGHASIAGALVKAADDAMGVTTPVVLRIS